VFLFRSVLFCFCLFVCLFVCLFCLFSCFLHIACLFASGGGGGEGCYLPVTQADSNFALMIF
jgi:hypothetical protein